MNRLTADEMDETRQKNVVYQYLCHLEEAKKWFEACIEEDLPDAENFEEEMRHGVYLAKLANFFSPQSVPLKKIFDADLARYQAYGLHYRHTDNINYFLKALRDIQLPKIFHPETTDIYEKKNIPKAIFCVHALSLFLFRSGVAPKIQNLYGKVQFSDDVMAAMSAELGKFGCRLPQFGKIGGILAGELPVNDALLLAALVALNHALEKRDMRDLEGTLTNPNCHFTDLALDNMEAYMTDLREAREEKRLVAFNKSREEGFIADVYDEMLTQPEIQGLLTQTNVRLVVEAVEMALLNGSSESLWLSLSNAVLGLKGLKEEWCLEYGRCLKGEFLGRKDQSLNGSVANCALSRSVIRRVVADVHETQRKSTCLKERAAQLNESLEKGCPYSTFKVLLEMRDGFDLLLEDAAPLYHEEMAAIRAETGVDLSPEEITSGVRVLTAVAKISSALDAADLEKVWMALSNPETHIQNAEKGYLRDYASSLAYLKASKGREKGACPLLTFLEVQDCVESVNEAKNRDNCKIAALTAVNKAVSCPFADHSHRDLLRALSDPALETTIASERNVAHFMTLLRQAKAEKGRCHGNDQLWLEDVLSVATRVTQHEAEATSASTFISVLQQALSSNNIHEIKSVLRQYNSTFYRVGENLLERVTEKVVQSGFGRSSEAKIRHILSSGHQITVNIRDASFDWEPTSQDPKTPLKSVFFIHGLQGIIQECSEQQLADLKLRASLIGFQAACRGYVCRRKLALYRESAIKIQSWWRMVSVRRSYQSYRSALRFWEPQIVKIQRVFRTWRERKNREKRMAYYRRHEAKITLIQRAWRNHLARIDLQALTHRPDPPFGVIFKFVHLLQVSKSDFDEEMRLQRVQSDVVKRIRNAHRLENRIDELDVKIGLLVQNRITLQDVVKSSIDKENVNPTPSTSADYNGAPLKKHKKNKDAEKYATVRSQRGLKALTKESREKLCCYQHLFYLLQIEPRYLATLVFSLPFSKTTRFVENVIFTLYNYGANDRDNFLLLKLFKCALEEEIRNRVLRLNDIVSGNPLVVKMIVSFHRKGAGQSSLRDILSPLVNKVISDSTLQISTNPVEIYKTWINQLEMKSGQPSGLPYSVDQDQAMQHPEVKTRLMKAINSLREETRSFCARITSSRHLLPYGLQYMSKVMKAALHKRFPHIPEKEILKVVGNVIYYRFINCAIVAPDAFDIISLPPDKKLSNDQRRNLASIAKILQFAASKKGFGEEASHLMGLNSFIVECHDLFRDFFKECTLVPDPEEAYGVTPYSEETLIIKPTIYITLQEVVQTHELLLDNEDVIAPDEGDPLHGLLRDLGERRPSVFALLGDTDPMEHGGTITHVGRTEICLALGPKLDLQMDAEEHKGNNSKDCNEKLFSKTTKLLVDLLQCCGTTTFKSVSAVTSSPTSPDQEAAYRTIVLSRAKYEQEAKLNETGLNGSNSVLNSVRSSLSELKTRLTHNLRRLETRGLTSRADGYQTILNAVARDIRTQSERRTTRRTELQRLIATLKKLEDKERFYEDQLASYNTYLNTCLTNLACRAKNVHVVALSSKNGKSKGHKNVVAYTGARLHERGVIIEIEDLPPNQLKNVMFEIKPLPASGCFQVQVKFMGVAMEVVEVDIQELLHLQYEGVNVKTMFGKAKVNVNMLLFLLNSKFYSKKK